MKLKYRNALARLINAGMVAHTSTAERVLHLREISEAIDDGQHTTAAVLIEKAHKRLAELQGEHSGWAWLESELVRLGTFNHFMAGDEGFKPDPRGVVELEPDDPKATVCGTCGRGWDDTVSTSCTPAPSGRCPFEGEHNSEADEIEQEDLEAASELLAKLEAGQLQCGCDPSSCDHKYLGDEPGPYPRDRREKELTLCLNCRQPRGLPAHTNPEGYCRNSTRQWDQANYELELLEREKGGT